MVGCVIMSSLLRVTGLIMSVQERESSIIIQERCTVVTGQTINKVSYVLIITIHDSAIDKTF